MVKVDTGVLPEDGDTRDDAEDGEITMDVTPELMTEPSTVATQRAMKTLFGEDEKEISEESDVIPTLEPLPPTEVSEVTIKCAASHDVRGSLKEQKL